MKLIFLDIDGVLNAHEWDVQAGCCFIDRAKMKCLNRVLAETGALVVVSSAWRYMVHNGAMTVTGFEHMLRTHGFLSGRLAGITRKDDGIDNERGQQIADYLADWPLVQRYAVVDDMDLGISAAGHPFVQTIAAHGLTDDCANRLIALLCDEKEGGAA